MAESSAPVADLPGREPLLQQRHPAAAPIPLHPGVLRGMLQDPGQAPCSHSKRGGGGGLSPTTHRPAPPGTGHAAPGTPRPVPQRRGRLLHRMCVSGPKAFPLQKQAPCRVGGASPLPRGFFGAWNHRLLPLQRDRGLPTTLPKEQSGAWTARPWNWSWLAAAWDPASPEYRAHQGAPPPRDVTAPWTNQSTITFTVPVPRLARSFSIRRFRILRGCTKCHCS